VTTWTWTPYAELSADALYELLALRQAVFVVEQNCPFLDADGLDPLAWHLAGHHDGQLVAGMRVFGPGVLQPEAVIGRVVSAPHVRRAGFGKELLRVGLDRLEATFGPVPVYAGAQAWLQRFYEGFGFVVSGPGYDEDGIAHLPMIRPSARLNPPGV
jgi:ElaA protein